MQLNDIKRKISSQDGASLTWALLLFVICAVVGSVVLTSGTATAGRFSKLSSYDERFYAVTSAVSMLRDILEESEVSIEHIKNITRTINEDGSSNDESSFSIYVNGADTSSTLASIVSKKKSNISFRLGLDLVYGKQDSNYDYLTNGWSVFKTDSFAIDSQYYKVIIPDKSGTSPYCDVILTIKTENNKLKIDFGTIIDVNNKGSVLTNMYSLEYKCMPEIVDDGDYEDITEETVEGDGTVTQMIKCRKKAYIKYELVNAYKNHV